MSDQPPEPGAGVSGGGSIGEVRFMVTNGGPHPASAWAQITTDSILELIQIELTNSPATLKAMAAKDDVRPKMLAMFTSHYTLVQNLERFAVVKKTPADKLDPSSSITGVCSDLYRLLAATPFADHFARSSVRMILYRIVGQHTANVMHIERRYFADKKQGD